MANTLVLLIIAWAIISQSICNLLCNGDFEEYGLQAPNWFQYANSSYSCWYNEIGEIIQIKLIQTPPTSTICQLSHFYPYILCQDVSLAPGALYELNFSTYSSFKIITSRITVKINGIEAYKFFTTTTQTFNQASYIFQATHEDNQICFSSVDKVVPYRTNIAVCLDNMTLIRLPELSDISLSQSQNFGISFLVSFPNKLIRSLRCLHMLLDDIWLYHYNKKNYTGLIQTIFSTIATIQLLKFEVLEEYLGWNKYKERLNISDYSNYTTAKFMQVEGSPSILLQSVFSFFVYTLPQNILFCLVLYGIFHLLRNYKISQCVRKFYFLKTVIGIVIFQENLGYLVFVCFSHLQHPFSFNFADKLSLMFTVLFLFGCFFFTFAFYLLLFRYLRKKCCYFTEFTYREFPGIIWKIIHYLARNVLRGAIFCFMHGQQKQHLIMLLSLEVILILCCLISQTIYRIFLSKTIYALHLAYGSLFVMFNAALLLEHEFSEGQVFFCVKEVEEVVIYLLISITILMMLADLLGLKRPNKLSIEQFEREMNLHLAVKKAKQRTKKRKVQFITQFPQLSKTIQKSKVQNTKAGLVKRRNNFFQEANTGAATKVTKTKQKSKFYATKGKNVIY